MSQTIYFINYTLVHLGFWGFDSAIVIVDPPKLMDPELCDIVLVKRDDMESWLSRQAKLKQDLDQTQQKVVVKLEECKTRYRLQLADIAAQKEVDIKDLQKRFDALDYQKEH